MEPPYRKGGVRMTERQPGRTHGLTVRSNQPLIGVIEQHDGQEVTRFFTEEPGESLPDADVQAALSVIGAWSDVDWEEMLEALDRIRHESPPTPPIEL
jgi:hypothetical protein